MVTWSALCSSSGTKSRYVDVLNPSRTSKPGGGGMAPAPADIFAPLAPMPTNLFVPGAGVYAYACERVCDISVMRCSNAHERSFWMCVSI